MPRVYLPLASKDDIPITGVDYFPVILPRYNKHNVRYASHIGNPLPRNPDLILHGLPPKIVGETNFAITPNVKLNILRIDE